MNSNVNTHTHTHTHTEQHVTINTAFQETQKQHK